MTRLGVAISQQLTRSDAGVFTVNESDLSIDKGVAIPRALGDATPSLLRTTFGAWAQRKY